MVGKIDILVSNAAHQNRKSRLAELTDEELVETFETNVPDLYVAGAVVAGVQSGRIFIENGRFHGQQVIDAIVRKNAATRV